MKPKGKANKRRSNYSDDEILAILSNNFNICDADKENYADRYSHAFRYYSGIEPADKNNTGVDPIPVVREIVDENFQLLQSVFNNSDSTSVIVTSNNIKSSMADAISKELNTVARNLNNVSRKNENWIKETLLTGQGHMKIFLEEKIEDERNIKFIDKTAEELEALEKALGERGFNDVSVKIKSSKSKRTSDAERQADSKAGKPVQKTVKLYTGSMNAVARVVFPAVDYIPFQEIYIHPLTQYSLDDAPYFCHSYMLSINDGLMNGWDEDVMLAGISNGVDSDASFATTGLIVGQQYDPYQTSGSGIALDNKQSYFQVFEHYWKGAYKGSVPKWWKFTTTHLAMLEDPEELDELPFVSARIHEVPNSFYGMGIYDTAKYLQDAATRESRMLTYSAANTTFGRYWALKDQYDPEALLTPRAGGVVEVDTPNAIGVLPTADVSQSLNLLMNETGNRIQAQMKSGGSIGEATEKYGEMAGVALSMLIDKTEQGPKSRAATFASTGLIPMYKKLYRLLQRINHPIPSLAGGYSMNDFPKEIGLSFDVSTTTDKQQAAQNIISAMTQAKELYGSMPNFITEENVYEALSQYVTAGTGNDDVSSYLTDPKTIKPNKLQIHMQAEQYHTELQSLQAQAEAGKMANGKLLSEIEMNNAHAAYYVAQMQQIKEQDKQNKRLFDLTEQKQMLDNKSLAMDVLLKQQEFEQSPVKLSMDAAALDSQLTAEQANIMQGDYVQGANA